MKINHLKNISLSGMALVGIAAFSIPTTSFAEIPAMSLGLGVASAPDYEGSNDNEAVAVPHFSAVWESNRSIKLSSDSLQANILSKGKWQFGPALQFQKTRDDDVDNNTVAKLREVDNKVRAGAFVGFNTGVWDVSLQMATDTSNDEIDDGGMLASLKAGYTYGLGNISTRAGISTTYADSDYMKTYFSIDPNNSSRSGLPTFNADSGLKDVGLDLAINVAVNDRWDVKWLLGYKALLNDAKDSPLVDREGDSGQFMGGVVGIYKF